MAKFGERYELIRRVGAGGMAEVWLARDEELAGRPVAIKIMHRHMLPNEDDVARFEREMRYAAMMDHPNIVTVYTTGACDGVPFLVMEYLRGRDLEKVPLGGDPGHIAAIGRDICRGLAYAHQAGVIHRDIKPGNLFLCESGQVKITDFGVARAVNETALSSAVLVGTFAYMPPERWRCEPSAFSSDVWAAGCVLYRLISGRLPRLLPDVGHYAAVATRGEPVPDLRDITDAPDWLADPVMAMLADDPARRPTAGECVQAFSSTPLSTSLPALSVGKWRLPGQLGPDDFVPGPVGAASEDPVTTPVARQAGTHPGTSRSRRLNRTSAAAGGMALLLAASLTAWRLSDSPQAAGLTAGGATSSGTNHAAAPAPSASRSGSSATSPPDPASGTVPASAFSGAAAGSASASPTGSRAASPASSPASSPPDSPFPSPTDTPAASPRASGTPSLVPVPDVVGMNFTQAQRVLESDGFTVAGSHSPPGNNVVSTSPSGEAPAGSVITVVYGS